MGRCLVAFRPVVGQDPSLVCIFSTELRGQVLNDLSSCAYFWRLFSFFCECQQRLLGFFVIDGKGDERLLRDFSQLCPGPVEHQKQYVIEFIEGNAMRTWK